MIVLPLIIFIILLFIVVGSRMKLFRNLFLFKMRWRFLIVYVIFLIAVTAIYLLVQPNTPKGKIIDNPIDNLYEHLNVSASAQMLEKYKKENWEVSLKGDTVSFIVDQEYEDYLYIPVAIVERDDGEKIMYVDLYETPTMIDHYDISDTVSLPEITVDGEEVVVSSVKQNDINFYSIRNDMTLTQFATMPYPYFDYFDVQLGEVGLVVSIPKGTKVNMDENVFSVKD